MAAISDGNSIRPTYWMAVNQNGRPQKVVTNVWPTTRCNPIWHPEKLKPSKMKIIWNSSCLKSMEFKIADNIPGSCLTWTTTKIGYVIQYGRHQTRWYPIIKGAAAPKRPTIRWLALLALQNGRQQKVWHFCTSKWLTTRVVVMAARLVLPCQSSSGLNGPPLCRSNAETEAWNSACGKEAAECRLYIENKFNLINGCSG